MIRSVLVLLIAAGTATAAADVPSGFVAHPELAQRAQVVAGKPLSVYCAANFGAWRTYVSSLNVPYAGAHGVTPVVGGDIEYIDPVECAPLTAKIKGRPFDFYDLGAALEILAHESEHVRGVADEHAADCAALADTPRLAVAFGVHKAKSLRKVMAAARAVHAKLPPPYNGPC